MLDLAISQPSVDVLRDQGFLTGFGIDTVDINRWGDETDERIVCNEVTAGNEEGGRTAMENCLAVDPEINVVYTINEPAAAGAFEALVAIGRQDDVTIVSVDGGCPGVQNVADGVIGATSQQYPLLMASLGIEAIAQYRRRRHAAGEHRRQGLLRHGRLARHRRAGGRGRVDLGRGRSRTLLGLRLLGGGASPLRLTPPTTGRTGDGPCPSRGQADGPVPTGRRRES